MQENAAITHHLRCVTHHGTFRKLRVDWLLGDGSAESVPSGVAACSSGVSPAEDAENKVSLATQRRRKSEFCHSRHFACWRMLQRTNSTNKSNLWLSMIDWERKKYHVRKFFTIDGSPLQNCCAFSRLTSTHEICGKLHVGGTLRPQKQSRQSKLFHQYNKQYQAMPSFSDFLQNLSTVTIYRMTQHIYLSQFPSSFI